ncbi:protein translocase subunit SecF [Synechococcus sp. CS-1325]|uniref:protein translocase subunit SecF n=1 Tax=Synechococcus sp. CS-1325 TaxID=2847979 RepID=UPI000DB16477|nr:protein translocase subunit SecF [Synechococcus sp. CS-1325]MCT0200892.1 protein translocase subunit SecF [Synechococcus sp. CS-1325]PZU96629.1 MAG: protein translocase subunit SecF [Cyanobium sp.]
MTHSPSPRFRISRYRRLAWLGSGLACLLSVVGLALSWLNPSIGFPLRPGLDFTGGTQIQLERICEAACAPLTAPAMQQRLADLALPPEDLERAPNLGSASVQVLDGGRSLLLRLPALSPEQSAAVIADFTTAIGPLDSAGTAINTIGPTLGSQLLQSSVISLLVSFAAIAAYITFRYDRVFAFLALVCLAHDVLITCGVFAWLGLLLGIEVDSLFAVSLVTVAGYSVNDTVVVFDRIREQKTSLGQLPVADQVDVAVDATLTRSLYTSLTTLLPLLAVIFFGGSSLFWFAVALTVGIAVGSWSSIGVAPTLLPLFNAPSPARSAA